MPKIDTKGITILFHLRDASMLVWARQNSFLLHVAWRPPLVPHDAQQWLLWCIL